MTEYTDEKDKKWNDDVAKFFTKEVEKLGRLNPAAGEYSVQFTFCQSLLEGNNEAMQKIYVVHLPVYPRSKVEYGIEYLVFQDAFLFLKNLYLGLLP